MEPPVYFVSTLKSRLGKGQKPGQIYQNPISEQIPLGAMFYFEQVFVFCILNVSQQKGVGMIYKEYSLLRSTNLLSRNHPKLCF